MQLAGASQREDVRSTGLLESVLALLEADALDPGIPLSDDVSSLDLFNNSISEMLFRDNKPHNFWIKFLPLEQGMNCNDPDKGYMLTTDSRFAYDPMSAKAGDAIWILGGCNSPMVLQQDPAGDGTRYTLIGQVYIHGSMHGEAVREPRPDLRRIMLV